MKTSVRLILLFAFLGFSINAFATDFLEDRERGWYWFEEQKLQEESPEEKVDFDPNQAMAELRNSIQKALNLAILVPTETHIQNYLRYQIKAFKMSERFTETAKVLQLQYPLLDYQREAPYNHKARIIKNQEDRTLAEQSVKALAKTHGLFFFFDPSCPYCAVMAPNAIRFAKKHDLYLTPISLKGGNLKEFPEAISDNGIADAYGVTHLPALFAVNPKTQEVLKLSNRVASVTELEDVVLRHALYAKRMNHGT